MMDYIRSKQQEKRIIYNTAVAQNCRMSQYLKFLLKYTKSTVQNSWSQTESKNVRACRGLYVHIYSVKYSKLDVCT